MSQGFDQTKFAALVLYIAARSKDETKFGAVKLNKILYNTDFNAYRRLGSAVAGASYQKLSEGPAPREMPHTRSLLVDSRQARIEYRPYFNGVQQRLVSLREPNVEIFETEELAIADETIIEFWHLSGRQVSDLSYTEIGWIVAAIGETIPSETSWLSSDPLPQEAEKPWRERVAPDAG